MKVEKWWEPLLPPPERPMVISEPFEKNYYCKHKRKYLQCYSLLSYMSVLTLNLPEVYELRHPQASCFVDKYKLLPHKLSNVNKVKNRICFCISLVGQALVNLR